MTLCELLEIIFITVLLVVLAFFIYDNRITIVQNVSKTVDKGETLVLPDNPNFKNNFDFQFVQETDDFDVKSKQDILNVLYTILNNGLDEFTFYCSQNYSSCVDDFKEISQDQVLLSTIIIWFLLLTVTTRFPLQFLIMEKS